MAHHFSHDSDPLIVLLAFGLLAGCGRSSTTLPSPPGVRAAVDTTYYETEGSTRRQWLASMHAAARAAGVRAPYLAHTAWQTRWSYAGSRLTTLGCEARLPSIDLTIHYTMPRLVSDSGVAPEDALEWRRHAMSLWRHEEGHALRALRAAAEMRDSLSRVRAPSCASLQPTIARAMDAVERKYRALQEAYDARTGHGARQGAVLALPGVRLPVDTTYRDTVP
jgi:predicted secreted Zn-dependent protease